MTTYEERTRDRPITIEADFSVLRDIQPGDLVVANVHRPVTREQAEIIQEQLRALLPEGVKTAVIPDAIDIELRRNGGAK